MTGRGWRPASTAHPLPTRPISSAEYRDMQASVMTEAVLQQRVLEIAQLLGWRAFHPYDSRRSVGPGYPDLTLVHPGQGRVLFRELKKARGRVSPEQAAWLADLTAAGADAGIWRPADLLEGRIARDLEASTTAAAAPAAPAPPIGATP